MPTMDNREQLIAALRLALDEKRSELKLYEERHMRIGEKRAHIDFADITDARVAALKDEIAEDEHQIEQLEANTFSDEAE